MAGQVLKGEHVAISDQDHREDSLDRILAMRKTEGSYCFQTFLQQQCQAQEEASPLGDTWRSKVTQWAFNVVDHFGLSREVVAVSMGIFDRYLTTRGNMCSGNQVLLTSLTTLHLAIKLHETKPVKSSILANLSRGQFDTAHIEEMELQILSALSWKLHAPTPLAFLSEFLNFLPQEVSAAERKEVFELSKYMTELAVCESSFVGRQNSVVALAAIRNVMDSMTFARLSEDAKEVFLSNILNIMGHTTYDESHSMRETRERLKTMFTKVSAADCFEASYGGAQSACQKTPTGSRIVSPSGSPSSATSSTYDVIEGARSEQRYTSSQHQKETKTRTNFWYTPSPPHSRSGIGAKFTAAQRGYE